MTQEQKHPPLPFKISQNGNVVDAEGKLFAKTSQLGQLKGVSAKKANAEFIVKACNSYYEVLDTLKWLIDPETPRLPFSAASRVGDLIDKMEGK